MNDLKSPDHPLWKILSYLAISTVVLAINASNFDHTEWKSIGEMMLLVGGVEAYATYKRNQGRPEDRPGG